MIRRRIVIKKFERLFVNFAIQDRSRKSGVQIIMHENVKENLVKIRKIYDRIN